MAWNSKCSSVHARALSTHKIRLVYHMKVRKLPNFVGDCRRRLLSFISASNVRRIWRWASESAIKTPRRVCWSIWKYLKFSKKYLLSLLLHFYTLSKDPYSRKRSLLHMTTNFKIAQFCVTCYIWKNKHNLFFFWWKFVNFYWKIIENENCKNIWKVFACT